MTPLQIENPDVLTERQTAIVKSLTIGETIKQISLKLNISQKTVEYHWAEARKRLKLWDIATVTHWAIVTKLIEPLFRAEFIKREVTEVKVEMLHPILNKRLNLDSTLPVLTIPGRWRTRKKQQRDSQLQKDIAKYGATHYSVGVV